MSATYRPYYEQTSEGKQLLHWEVLISTPERDTIEILKTRNAAIERTSQINAATAYPELQY